MCMSQMVIVICGGGSGECDNYEGGLAERDTCEREAE